MGLSAYVPKYHCIWPKDIRGRLLLVRLQLALHLKTTWRLPIDMTECRVPIQYCNHMGSTCGKLHNDVTPPDKRQTSCLHVGHQSHITLLPLAPLAKVKGKLVVSVPEPSRCAYMRHFLFSKNIVCWAPYLDSLQTMSCATTGIRKHEHGHTLARWIHHPGH